MRHSEAWGKMLYKGINITFFLALMGILSSIGVTGVAHSLHRTQKNLWTPLEQLQWGLMVGRQHKFMGLDFGIWGGSGNGAPADTKGLLNLDMPKIKAHK